jgi:peptidoglycan hydrolase-like protein with peptidoglycan-binding domain
MNISAILGMLPLIMKAISLAREIAGNTELTEKIKTYGADIIDLVRQAGAEIFPNLNVEEQTQAGALRFSPEIVSKIQSQLNKFGASPRLAVDGDYGKLTKAAVTAYQTKNDLDPDGWAGPLTQAKLFA